MGFGDDIDTDIIIPTEYLALKTIDDMKQYGFLSLRPELADRIKPGDIIVAGKNLAAALPENRHRDHQGTVSSVLSQKILARIFFRNSINNGLLLIEQPTS